MHSYVLSTKNSYKISSLASRFLVDCPKTWSLHLCSRAKPQSPFYLKSSGMLDLIVVFYLETYFSSQMPSDGILGLKYTTKNL